MTSRVIFFLLNFIGLGGALTWGFFYSGFEPWLATIPFIIGSLISGTKLRRYIRESKPVSEISVSILGSAGCGKTVYVTMLFDEFQQNESTRYDFSPYGSMTIEKYLEDLSLLKEGDWPYPSTIGLVSKYYAYVTKRGFSWAEKYRLHLTDYSGEDFSSFSPLTGDVDRLTGKDASKFWFHREPFFQEIIDSNIILFAIDLQHFNLEKLSRYTAALHLLAEKKNKGSFQKIKEPVCIIFLKTDYLEGRPEDVDQGSEQRRKRAVVEKAQVLISACKNRCVNYKYFFVSSVGSVDAGVHGYPSPKTPLSPVNVIDPIEWALDCFNK